MSFYCRIEVSVQIVSLTLQEELHTYFVGDSIVRRTFQIMTLTSPAPWVVGTF